MPAPKSVLTALSGALLALLVVAGPAASAASAASEDSRDAPKDVVSRDGLSDAQPRHLEPTRRLGDVIRTQVTLGSDLVITTKLRSLAAIGHQEFDWTVVT